MRWLEWSTIDLKNGLGGVEVHARSIARELEKKGVQVSFSQNPADVDDPSWDVIHTHGSAPAPKGHSRAIRVHTLHGTTLGRMAACGEWTWPGGYAAAARELRGVRLADVVITVRPNLGLYSLASRLGKTCAVCFNGWDAQDLPNTEQNLPVGLKDRLKSIEPFWLFVGRGADRMKGADRLRSAIRLLPDLRWAAAPGDGFEDLSAVIKTGKLSSTQVRELMSMAAGLVLPSRYEGHSLVLLEALSQGLPTVATRVGGVPVLPDGVQGLIIPDSSDPRSLADAMRAAQKFSNADREKRAALNQKLLHSWSQVADIYLDSVRQFQAKRGKV